MSNDVIEAFNDVSQQSLPPKPEGINGASNLQDIASMQIGTGAEVFRGDSSGIWLGAEKFADAPFSVDMNGNLIATSATITGMGKNFVSTLAWTATDLDTATWAAGTIKTSDGVSYSISGGNTGDITSPVYIYLDPATSITVLQQTTTAANAAGSGKVLIAIVQKGSTGSQCLIDVIGGIGTTINGSRIVTGSISANQIASDAITADKIDVSTLSAISANLGTVTAGSLTADVVNTGTLNADRIPGLDTSKVVSGAFSIGASNQPTYIQIKRDDGSGSNAYLRFEGGSKMWADSSNRIGINSLGSPMYIYINSNEQIVIPNGGQTTIRNGAYLDGNVNITGEMRCNKITMDQSSSENNIDKINIIKGYNDVNFQLGSDSYYFSFYDTGFNEKAHITSGGDIQKDGSVSFDIKHPEKKNYRLRYCAVESPEVALTFRGVGKLVKGELTIKLPRHWELVTEKKGLLTVNLTPLEDCNGLFAPKAKLKSTSFMVKELQKGKSNAEFTWEFSAVRKGYLNFDPEIPLTDVQKEKLKKEIRWRKQATWAKKRIEVS